MLRAVTAASAAAGAPARIPASFSQLHRLLQRPQQLLPPKQQLHMLLLRQVRGLKYIAFHPRSKKPRKIAPPPPVYAVNSVALVPTSDILSNDQERQQQQQQQQLSPFQAVKVLQAFLPLQPVQAEGSPTAGTTKTPGLTAPEKQRQQEQQLEKQRDDSAIAGAPAAAETKAADRQAAFDPLVYLVLRVNADLKRESVRGVCTLQHGVGSEAKLAVFCPEEEAPSLLALGADFAGGEALVQKVAKGWVGFDKAIAAPSMMPMLLKAARVLGPKKLMPSPKSGTVVSSLGEAVKAIKSGRSVEFRAEGDGEIKAPIGRVDFSREQMLENCKVFILEVLKAQPRSSGETSATSGHGTSFEWPPKAFLQRRQQRMAMQGRMSAADLSRGASQAEKESDRFFIRAASICAQGTPQVNLQPSSLHPSSHGYFR